MTEERRLVSREELAVALNETVGRVGWLRSTPSDPVEEWRANADAIFAALPQPATEPALDWTDDPMAEARRIAERFPDGLIAWLLAAQPPAEVERLRAANDGLREALRDACTLLPADRYSLLREATQRWYTMTDRDFRAALAGSDPP
jgi:hypothetical protein